MKIVQVVHGYPQGVAGETVGGTEQYVREITEGLRDRGHTLFVYAGSVEWREEFSAEATEVAGCEVTRVHRNDLYFDRWDNKYNPLVEEHFRAYLAHRKPDVVNVHQWIRLTSNLCAIAAGEGIPVVVTLHDYSTTCPRLFRVKRDGELCLVPLSPENCLRCTDRWLFQKDEEVKGALASFKVEFQRELKSATRVLSPTWSHASAMMERLEMDDVEILLLPMARRRTLNTAPRTPNGGKIVIVFFSHLYPHKGPRVLVEAFGRMRHKDQAELHLFGAEVLPDFTDELKEMANSLDVTFHGAYTPEDLERFPMDVVVIPSLAPETHSFILDEAAELGVPVIASDSGALGERAGRSVMLFRRGDEKDLAEKLDELAEDRDVLNIMRTSPGVNVLLFDEHLDRLERIYGEVVEEGPRAVGPDRTAERLREQWVRREHGFKELIRAEQWEILTASLRKRIDELEREIGSGLSDS